jgi:hypothetical protein
LVAIQGFDEVNGNFSVVGFLEVTWYDTRMTWDPLEYNNTYSILFSQEKAAIWIKNQANSHIVCLDIYFL